MKSHGKKKHGGNHTSAVVSTDLFCVEERGFLTIRLPTRPRGTDNDVLGAGPPVDLLAVCFVLAIMREVQLEELT
jgi:hypothetical protein